MDKVEETEIYHWECSHCGHEHETDGTEFKCHYALCCHETGSDPQDKMCSKCGEINSVKMEGEIFRHSGDWYYWLEVDGWWA